MIYLVTKNKKDIANDIAFRSIDDCLHYFQDGGCLSIGVDTETTGFDPHLSQLLTIQIGDENNQFVIDCITIDINLLRPILENPANLLIFQNAKFDLKFLYNHGIFPEKVWDTYLAEGVINKGDKSVRKSLEVLIKRYCNFEIDKSIRGRMIKEGLTNLTIRYAAKDVQFLKEIKHKQEKKLKELDLLRSIELENAFVHVLAYVEYCGIYLDANKWYAKMQKDNKNFEKAKEELNIWVINNGITPFVNPQLDLFTSEPRCNIKWSSSKQVIQLFKYLNINTQIIDDATGNPKDSVDAKKVLLQQRGNHPIIEKYMEYKKYEKVVSTYGETFLNQIHPKTGRIHSSFTQIMDTGRLSCGGKNKNTKEEYINLQNIPADSETRSCFTHAPGNILINADYTGQEQIVFANWTQDPDLLDFYRQGLGDMHSYIASKIYPELSNASLDEIMLKHPNKRQEAKRAGFAINYGGTGYTISQNLGISEEEGNFVYNAYFKAFPGIKKYFNKITGYALKHGYILFNNLTRSKSFIPFFEEYKKLENTVNAPNFWEVYREEKRLNSDLYLTELKPIVRNYFKKKGEISRKALNYPIQGSSAEITKIACINIFKYIKKQSLLSVVKITNIIHDEIVLEMPEEIAPSMKIVVKKCMEDAGNLFCKIVKLQADPHIVDWWKHSA